MQICRDRSLLPAALLITSMFSSGLYAQSEIAADKKEAQFHYKVALTAIQNNDYEIAARELQTAAQLAPDNALIQYTLGIVESKSGQSRAALVSLKRAIDLGLPRKQAKPAEDLLVQLTYEAEKGDTSGELSWLKGTWTLRYQDNSGDLEMGVSWSNLGLACNYAGQGSVEMVIAEDPEHSPDRLIGRLEHKFQADRVFEGTFGPNDPRDIQACISHFGIPQKVAGIETFNITTINSAGSDRAHAHFVLQTSSGTLVRIFGDSSSDRCLYRKDEKQLVAGPDPYPKSNCDDSSMRGLIFEKN